MLATHINSSFKNFALHFICMCLEYCVTLLWSLSMPNQKHHALLWFFFVSLLHAQTSCVADGAQIGHVVSNSMIDKLTGTDCMSRRLLSKPRLTSKDVQASPEKLAPASWWGGTRCSSRSCSLSFLLYLSLCPCPQLPAISSTWLSSQPFTITQPHFRPPLCFTRLLSAGCYLIADVPWMAFPVLVIFCKIDRFTEKYFT